MSPKSKIPQFISYHSLKQQFVKKKNKNKKLLDYLHKVILLFEFRSRRRDSPF